MNPNDLSKTFIVEHKDIGFPVMIVFEMAGDSIKAQFGYDERDLQKSELTEAQVVDIMTQYVQEFFDNETEYRTLEPEDEKIIEDLLKKEFEKVSNE